MAATVTENKIELISGMPGKARLYVTVDLDVDTSVAIIPGTPQGTTAITGSSGLRKIDMPIGVNNITAANPFYFTKAYNATYDCDQVTITGTAQDQFEIVLEGPYNAV